MHPTSRRAFVTGGTGFVGLNLIEELIAKGWKVTALHRKSSDLTYLSRLDAERVEGDINEPETLRSAIPKGVDAIFHTAANVNFWSRRNREQTRDNVLGTQNVVTAALERNAGRFIHTSSVAAWGQHDHRIDESTPSTGSSSWINYVRTKAVGEMVVRNGVEKGLDAVILNPSNILGPYDQTSWARMIYLAHAGRLPGVPPGRASFCHVREVARAHVAAVDKGRKGENYLLGGTEASYVDMVRIIGEVSGRELRARAIPYPILRAVARISVIWAAFSGKHPRVTPEGAVLSSKLMICDSSKAERELGYRPAPLREMIEDAYRWMEREGRLSNR